MAKYIKLRETLEVRKSEDLINASYMLSLLAMKMINFVIANIDKDDSIDEKYAFRVLDFKEVLGTKSNKIYTKIPDILEELLTNEIKIENKIIKGWISKGNYKEGIITVLINPKLRPHLFKEKPIKYLLKHILNIKSIYAIRMYELLTLFSYKFQSIIELDKLRKILHISDGYKYSQLKRGILEYSKKELEKNTDIVFDYEEIKTWNKVTYLKFSIKQLEEEIIIPPI